MLGTIVNTLAVLAGSILGLLLTAVTKKIRNEGVRTFFRTDYAGVGSVYHIHRDQRFPGGGEYFGADSLHGNRDSDWGGAGSR